MKIDIDLVEKVALRLATRLHINIESARGLARTHLIILDSIDNVVGEREQALHDSIMNDIHERDGGGD